MSTVEVAEGAQVSVASRNQKKALKALKGTGIKKAEGFSRVVLRKRVGQSFVVEDPEVYITPNGSYIVFGEPKVVEPEAAQQQLSNLGAGGAEVSEAPEASGDKSPEDIQADLAAAVNKASLNEPEEEVDDDKVDLSGLDTSKVDMLMEQANCSKNKAALALRKHDGDLINALMELTE